MMRVPLGHAGMINVSFCVHAILRPMPDILGQMHAVIEQSIGERKCEPGEVSYIAPSAVATPPRWRGGGTFRARARAIWPFDGPPYFRTIPL